MEEKGIENDINDNTNDEPVVDDTVSDDDSQSKFGLPDNINISAALMWGIGGFVIAFVLVFFVSLFAGTLAFVFGRILLFGIIFFLLGAGIRLLINIFAPEVFKEDDNDNISNEMDDNNNDLNTNASKDRNDLGGNINTSIDDKIDTDPLWSDEMKEDDNQFEKKLSDKQKMKDKYGEDADYIQVDGTEIVFPNNAELMAEGIRTMMDDEEE